MKVLQDLFLSSLEDMYYAEQHLAKALPKMVKAATDDDLREALQAHLKETAGHITRVEQVFAQFGEIPRGRKCQAIVGIIKEADEIISENKKSPTINAALIYAAQKAEHYEIASYGTLRQWARQLHRDHVADFIDEILQQEKAADEKLTRLGETHCNESAVSEHAFAAA